MSEKRECYYNKFAIALQCPNEAVWRTTGTGNMTETWTWCAEHAPAPVFRAPLADKRDVAMGEL